jgi:hypothetical protein
LERGYGKEINELNDPRNILKNHCQFVTLLSDSIQRKNVGKDIGGLRIRTTEDMSSLVVILMLARAMKLKR